MSKPNLRFQPITSNPRSGIVAGSIDMGCLSRMPHPRLEERPWQFSNNPFSLVALPHTLLDHSPIIRHAQREISKGYLVSYPDLMYFGGMRYFASAFVVVLLVASCDYTAPAVSSDTSSGEFIGGERKTVDCSAVCTCPEQKCAFDCGTNGCGSATCSAGDCTGICGMSACVFACMSESTCNYECPNGGCTFTCDKSKCTAKCPAGGCAMNCNNGASCEIECGVPGSCTLNCNGSTGVCHGDCLGAGCGI